MRAPDAVPPRGARRARSAATIFGAALVLVPAPARADISRDCNNPGVWNVPAQRYGPAWAPWHPSVVLTRFRPLADSGRFARIFEGLGAYFNQLVDTLNRGASPLPPAVVSAVAAQLDTARQQFAAVEASPERIEMMARAEGVRLTRFDYGGPDYIVFKGRSTPVDLKALPDSGQRRAVCWTALVAREVMNLYAGPSRAVIADELAAHMRRWDAYRDVRYSLYPWEILVNAIWRNRESLDPPRSQLILLHPGVGVELGGVDLDSLRKGRLPGARGDNAITIEWVGGVWYNAARTSLRGVSLVSSLTREPGWDLGALVHFGPGLRLGATWQRVSGATGGDRYGIVTSFDLYKRVMSRTAAPGGSPPTPSEGGKP